MRLEPVSSPLGHPDTLVFGIRAAVDEILERFLNPVDQPCNGPVECRCGCNPLQAFFVAGEQAMLEALVLLQAESQTIPAAERASTVAELRRAIRQVAHRETAAIAGLCQNPAKASQAVDSGSAVLDG